jgi:hypothetical protein
VSLYGCGSLFVAVNGEQSLRISENRMPNRILARRKQVEVNEDGENDVTTLYFVHYFNIMRLIKSGLERSTHAEGE